MKKIITAILALTMVVVCFAGCGNDPLNQKEEPTQATTETQAQTTKAVNQADYDDNLKGLYTYLADSGLIEINSKEAKKTVMEASLIGAENGVRYSYKYNNSDVNIELYAYNLNNLNDTAKKTLDSIKKNGCFTVLSETDAVISNNGKYVMVYMDSSKESDNNKREKNVTQAFKEFKA